MFRNTGANAFAKNQMRLAYEDKRDLYCMQTNARLRGSRPQKITQLYLRNVTMDNGDTDTDILNSVKTYGVENNVDIQSAYVVHNTFSDKIVGCKINVPECQVDIAMSECFWTTDIDCRRWQKQRPQGTKTEYHDNGNLKRTVYS